ncbi:psbP domain-containing protein 5, chloroplastic isoform X3 [Diospyros lotus]|uniref:psbP domain-containing protein 5, chloroplastic isoform X3 n=1 Tax=Diospyros lotus TaxID=55363 RepID=UPI00224DB6CC|nr:psbP domain-containing protein 5, chloroplastic isoform X3 [Diospyros lotus]
MKAMATVHLFPSHYHSHFLCTSNYPLLPYPYLYRKRAGAARVSSDERKCRVVGKIVLCSCAPLDPNLENGRFSRRDLMKFFGFSSSLAIIFPPSGLSSTKEVEMASLIDDINAYSYLYPTELPSKKFVFKWVESRKPERYSSAAPLAPDARLRIVSERVDIIDNLVISISIGPPNAQFLKSKDKSTWNAKDVADSVLSDKAALIDGEPYWYYEYLVRKSPTQSAQESNIFRHYISSTAERDGYLYSLSASTLGKQWNLDLINAQTALNEILLLTSFNKLLVVVPRQYNTNG